MRLAKARADKRRAEDSMIAAERSNGSKPGMSSRRKTIQGHSTEVLKAET